MILLMPGNLFVGNNSIACCGMMGEGTLLGFLGVQVAMRMELVVFFVAGSVSEGSYFASVASSNVMNAYLSTLLRYFMTFGASSSH
jgi:hypothetical protein